MKSKSIPVVDYENRPHSDQLIVQAVNLRTHLKTHSEENLLITLTKKLHHVAASEIAQEWEFQSSTPRNLKLINIIFVTFWVHHHGRSKNSWLSHIGTRQYVPIEQLLARFASQSKPEKGRSSPR